MAFMPSHSLQLGGQASPDLALSSQEVPSLELQLKQAWMISCGPDEKPGALEYVELVEVAGSSHEYVAMIDWQQRWWGTWCYFRTDGGLITEIVWGGQVEQSVHQVAGFRDERFEGVLVAVHGITHMGNGSYYLQQVREGRVHDLIETRAVDWHQGGDRRILGGGVLWPLYADFDLDGYKDVFLQGVELEVDDPDRSGGCRNVNWVPAPPQAIRKVFRWNPGSRTFDRLPHADIGNLE